MRKQICHFYNYETGTEQDGRALKTAAGDFNICNYKKNYLYIKYL